MNEWFFSPFYSFLKDNENDVVGQTLQMYQCGKFVPYVLGPIHVQRAMGQKVIVKAWKSYQTPPTSTQQYITLIQVCHCKWHLRMILSFHCKNHDWSCRRDNCNTMYCGYGLIRNWVDTFEMSVSASMALMSPNLPDRHMWDILKMWKQWGKDCGLPQKSL